MADCKSRLIKRLSTTTTPLPELFRSLADPTRLRILRLLQGREMTVGELAHVLDLAQSGVSRHLAVLRSAGLLADRREGASTWCRLPDLASDARTAELWAVVSGWLAELPEAAGDEAHAARVIAARRTRAQEYFDQVAPHWDSVRAAQYGDELRASALLELLPRELTVLDVGTGTGFMLVGLAGRVSRLVGVDASEAMLAKARENLVAAGVPEPDLRRGSMDALPVEDGEVDVVLANMSLHHAGDPEVALAEMWRALAPGGRVVLTDLALHELAWTREELADEWPGFEPGALARMLERAGFGDARVRPVGTCTLARAGGRERHDVPLLLATATKNPVSPTARKANRSR